LEFLRLGNFNCQEGKRACESAHDHGAILSVEIPERGTTFKIGQNSANFPKILSKGQTKYLRPNRF